MNSKILILTLFIYSLLCCDQRNKSNQIYKKHSLDSTTSTPLNNIQLIDSLKLKILNTGDFILYNQVHSYYSIETRTSEFLYYSMIMAHKYNYADAYYDVFFTLTESDIDNEMKNLDIKTRYLALFYLLKAHELGVKNASFYVKNIFGEGSTPKSNYYLQELSKLE